MLVAANKGQTEQVCKKISIHIKGAGNKFYIEEGDIIKQLEKIINGSIVNKPANKMQLAALENALKINQWIQDAELYFDRQNTLHVMVEEREPIARIFTTENVSFYLDSLGHRMPLLEKMSVRVPVVTGFTNAKKYNNKDSILLNDVKKVLRFINNNEFWNAQIGEIDITAERKFELIPVIGDHVIRIGNAENIDKKLAHLMIFYKQVLRTTGFNKYSVVDVQHDGQVIGVKKGATSLIDSIQLQKNIKELLERSTIQTISDEMLLQQKEVINTDSIQNNIHLSNPVPVKTNPIPAKKINPNSAKKITVFIPISKGTNEKPKRVKMNSAEKPKAVMRKRN